VTAFLSSSRHVGTKKWIDADALITSPQPQKFAWFGASVQYIPEHNFLLIGAPGGRQDDAIVGRVYGFHWQPLARTNIFRLTIDGKQHLSQFGLFLVRLPSKYACRIHIGISAPSESRQDPRLDPTRRFPHSGTIVN
jgi:hypothetical protein